MRRLLMILTVERPWVGERPIREFEQMLLGIPPTSKSVSDCGGWKRGALSRPVHRLGAGQRKHTGCYYRVQQALSDQLLTQMTDAEKPLRSFNRHPFGQITDAASTFRSKTGHPWVI